MGFGQFVTDIVGQLGKIATAPIPQGSIAGSLLASRMAPVAAAAPQVVFATPSANYGQYGIPDVQMAALGGAIGGLGRQIPGILGGLLLGEGIEGMMNGTGSPSSAAFHQTPAGNVVANNVRDEINPGTGKRAYWIRARPSGWTGPISVTKKRHHHAHHHHPR